MSRKRKYTEVKGYWVYSIYIPSVNKYYIGVSKLKCSQRWQKSMYKTTVLNEYLDEFELMKKKVLIDGLTKEQSLIYEDNILRALSMNNLCINSKRSGLITNDRNAYNREFLKNNPEYREREKQRAKQWQKDNKEKKREYDKQRRLRNKQQQHTVVH